jgi:signal transduction histidine kinase
MAETSDARTLARGAAQFGQFVLDNWERMIRHWITTVDRSPEVPAADDLTYRQLVDHLPELCRELGSHLKRPDVPAIQDQADRDAGEHGRKRWQQGYNLGELIRELCLIRNDVLDVWLEVFAREHATFDSASKGVTRRMVQRFFDDLVIQSTVQFAAQQIDEVGRIERALREAQNAAHTAKSEVLHHLSHTLREPLAAISFAAQALNMDKTLSPEARDSVWIILRNVKIEARSVDELLLAAKMHLLDRG